MKRFVVEIEEGKTECKDCPFGVRVWDNHWGEYEYKCGAEKLDADTRCGELDMKTIKVIKQENEN